VDAERFLVSVEDAKLRGAYVDPAAGRVAFSEWAERWERTTVSLRPNTRKDYRTLLKNQVLPAFGGMTLVAIDALAVREWVAELVAGGLSAKRARKVHRSCRRSWRARWMGAGSHGTWPRASSCPRCSARRCIS
jgi:Phage integrase, N-terminal SAM-like domain